MNNIMPHLKEWKELYKASIEFKDIEAWNWMDDTNIFGVQNPVSGEIGYCCILGNLREVFGLVVHTGTEGLRGYLKMQSGKIPPNDIEILYYQNCLMASFEDRSYLQKEDLSIIRELGLKFKGRHSWPLFRNLSPGYYPWFLNINEVKFLTLALQQAAEVCLRFKEDRNMLTPSKLNHYFIRVPVKKGNNLTWREHWLEPSLLRKKENAPVPIDELRMENIRKKLFNQHGIWEIDYFYSPMPVKDEKQRPYYPYVFLWIDQDSYFILHHNLTGHHNYELEFLDQFLSVIEEYKLMPQEVWVKKEELFKLIEPIISGLGINLRLVKRLKAVKNTRTSMFRSLK